MGAQQILIKNQENYYQEAHKKLLKEADAFYLKKKFLIGVGEDKDKVRYNQLLEEVLCIDSCELIDYIYKKIEGTLVSERKNKISKLEKALAREEEHSTIINIFNTDMHWENVAW